MADLEDEHRAILAELTEVTRERDRLAVEGADIAAYRAYDARIAAFHAKLDAHLKRREAESST